MWVAERIAQSSMLDEMMFLAAAMAAAFVLSHVLGVGK